MFLKEYFVAEAMQCVLNIALICGKCLLNALPNFCCKMNQNKKNLHFNLPVFFFFEDFFY